MHNAVTLSGRVSIGNRALTRVFPSQLLLAILLCLALAATVVNAQVLSGTLTGSVVDSTDAVVPNAKVTVKDLGTGKEYNETTDSVGVFTITELPNGYFSVTVEHPGFAKTVIAQVQVFVSQTSKVNIKLEVAKTGTEVVVQAEQAAVQTESVELKNSIERKQIMDLPLPTRNPLDLVKTFAGIISPNSSTIGDSYVHGLRGNVTNLTQDGINVADNFVKTSAFFAISAPIVDTIGEMNVSVGGIGADAGFGAAQVSMITQRGTNTFHGEAYWYQRTNELNANTWFNNKAGVARPFQLQNRLGASAGGPVVIPKVYHGKNKTFVFGAYEAYREPLSRFRERTVLTDTARTGNFTYSASNGSGLQTVNLLKLGAIGNSGAAPAINNNVMGVYNKYIPTAGLTDAGCSSGDTRNIRCLAFNLPGKNIQDRYTLRIDHQLTEKHSVQFVWNQADYSSIPDLLNAIEPQFLGSPGGGQLSRRQVFVWAVQSVFSPTLTNEARVGYQRAPVAFAYPNDFSETGGFQINTAGVLTNPILTSTNLPQGRNTPVRQAIDNVAWIKGDHQVRFGGEYHLQLANSFLYNSVFPLVQLGNNTANPDGLSSGVFPGGISSSDLTRAQTIFDTITGLYSTVQRGYNHTSPTSGYVPGVPQSYNPIQQNFAWYVQDGWKIRRNLNIQYGVRWEYEGPYDERAGLVLLPSNGIQGAFGPTPVGQFFSPGNTNGATDVQLTLQGSKNGHPVTHRDLNNFAPFVGFAWDPFKDGKTSVRAAFATHFAQDGFTAFTPATTANAGLFFVPQNTTPVGVYNPSAVPSPPAPASNFPVSQAANFAASNAQSITAFNPNLATPYVFEWNVGIQRELWKKFAMEVRYVGNHSVKEYRTWNANEVDLNQNGLLTDFLNAQNNYNINQANGVKNTFAFQGLPGQVATPILDKLFTGVAAGSAYGSSSFITNLTQNTVGTMMGNIRRSPVYAKGVALLPSNFFVANPLANSAFVVDNSGWSKFDGLEVEVNRRFSSFFLQGTYTFSKVMADTTFASSQTEGQNYQSVINRGLDKFRSGIDTTHSFGMNFLYPLPVGHGQKFLNSAPKVLDVLVGGWQITGFTRWSSGAPFSITSRAGITGSLLTNNLSIANMTTRQLQEQVGTFRAPNGIYWLNPNSGLLKVNGASSTPTLCTAGQTTPCFFVPAPGQIGNIGFNFLSGPRFFNQDFALIKNTKIYERINFQIRLEAFDAFNNANFQGLQTGVDSTTFGQMTATVDTTRSGGVNARIVQWAAKVTF